MSRVRIVGGEWKRRFVSFRAAPGLRPTPDAVRETLFNWLGQDLSGLACLDLFAGTGVLGFEAASRMSRWSSGTHTFLPRSPPAPARWATTGWS